jgi:hypothetical protein
VQLRPADLPLWKRERVLPAEDGLLAIEGDVVVTSTQWLEGALEVRFFNPMDTESTATLHLGTSAHFTHAEQVDFESNATSNAFPLEKMSATVVMGAKKIVTLRLTGQG